MASTKRKMRDNEWERGLTKVGKEKKGLPLKNGLFLLTKSNFYDQIISKTLRGKRRSKENHYATPFDRVN